MTKQTIYDDVYIDPDDYESLEPFVNRLKELLDEHGDLEFTVESGYDDYATCRVKVPLREETDEEYNTRKYREEVAFAQSILKSRQREQAELHRMHKRPPMPQPERTMEVVYHFPKDKPVTHADRAEAEKNHPGTNFEYVYGVAAMVRRLRYPTPESLKQYEERLAEWNNEMLRAQARIMEDLKRIGEDMASQEAHIAEIKAKYAALGVKV